MVNLSCAPLELMSIPSYDYIFLSTHMFLIVNTYLVYQILNNLEIKETLFRDENFENVYPSQYHVKIVDNDKLKTE
jgi:hypothetical protein